MLVYQRVQRQTLLNQHRKVDTAGPDDMSATRSHVTTKVPASKLNLVEGSFWSSSLLNGNAIIAGFFLLSHKM